MKIDRLLWIAALLAAVAVGSTFATAGETGSAGNSKPGTTRDDELLKRLDSRLDEYDRELSDDKPAKPAAGEDIGRPKDGPRPEPKPAAKQKESSDDPLVVVTRQMREVQQRMTSKDAGPVTQHLQSQIVADLNRLLDEAKKSGSSGKNGKPQGAAGRPPIGQKPPSSASKPGNGGGKGETRQPTESDPNAKHGKPAGGANASEVRSLMKQLWGELPEREREQMLELPDEEFLPKYEQLIEEYFRRLSEEKARQERDR